MQSSQFNVSRINASMHIPRQLNYKPAYKRYYAVNTAKELRGCLNVDWLLSSQTRGCMGWYLDSVTYPLVNQVATKCYILCVLCILLTVTYYKDKYIQLHILSKHTTYSEGSSGGSWGLILPHGGLELGSTTTTSVGHSRPGGEALVVGCTSLGCPAGGWGRL